MPRDKILPLQTSANRDSLWFIVPMQLDNNSEEQLILSFPIPSGRITKHNPNRKMNNY